MKKTLILALSAMYMLSCSNSNSKMQQESEEVSEEVNQVEVVEVVEEVKYASPEEKYAGKTIKLKGYFENGFTQYYTETILYPDGYVSDHFKSHEVVKVRGVDRWYDNGEKKGTWSMYTKSMGANKVVVFEVAVNGNTHYFTEKFDYYFRGKTPYLDFKEFNTDNAFTIKEYSVE